MYWLNKLNLPKIIQLSDKIGNCTIKLKLSNMPLYLKFKLT